MPDQQSDEYVLARHRPPAWTGGDGIDISRRKQRLEGDSTKPKMRGRGRAQTVGQSKQLGELVMKVTSVPETRVVLTLTRSAPAPEWPTMRSQRRWRGLTPRAGRCEGDFWEKKSIRLPADRRLCCMFCLAASGLTPWSRSQHTVRRCECRCHRLSVTPHPGCRLRARQATCYRVRPAHRPGREKGSREKL